MKAGRLAVLMAAVGALALAVAFLPVGQWVLALVRWTRSAGAPGVLVFAGAYVLAAVLLLPGSLLTVAAGFLYGPVWGTLLVSPASVFGATLAFTLGRSLARPWITRKVASMPRFAAIDDAVGREGFNVVFLLRLSPVVPFNLLNYALGLTQLSLRKYVVASAFGMLPGTFLYVYLGSLVTSVTELSNTHRSGADGLSQALYWTGLVATLAVTIILTRIARRALGRALEARGPHGSEAGA